MDEQQIEAALRTGPLDEPGYRGDIGDRLRLTAGIPANSHARGTDVVAVAVLEVPSHTRRRWPALFGAAAAAIVLLAGVVAVTRRDSTPSMTAEPTTTTPTTTAEPGSSTVPDGLPAELLGRWVGPTPVSIVTPDPSAPAFVVFSVDQVTLEHLAGGIVQNFTSHATATKRGQLQLRLSDQVGRCAAGAIGDYRWSLSSQWSTLTLEAVDDACADRAAAMSGTWTHTACPLRGSDCLGTLESGRYSSVNFDPFDSESYGQVAYSVPDGWSSTLDDKARLVLLPPEANGTGVYGLYLFADVAPATVDCPAKPGEANGAAAIADAITATAGILTATSQTTVGAFDATIVDITSASPTCNGEQPVLTSQPDSATPWTLATSPSQQMRIVLVGLPNNRTMAVVVVSDRSESEYASLLEASATVIESLDLVATP